MRNRGAGLRVMDLFCGAGGFSEGFRMAGFDVVYGIDLWKPACDTHEVNGLGPTDRADLLKCSVDDVIVLKKRLEEEIGRIDVLIGSPPCTEFSFAKNGGKGDIERGMLLVRKHLLFVSIFKPRYWLMENVPRLGTLMAKEFEESKDSGWRVPLERLGIPKSRFKKLGLRSDALEIPSGSVQTASDYGTCESRDRFVAGNYPLDSMESYKVENGPGVYLGGLHDRLGKNIERAETTGRIRDPNYPSHFVRLENLRDHDYDTTVHPMHWEEMRHLKRRHIQYGRMALLDNLNSPARTIMATFNRSSREALLFDTGETKKYQGRMRPIYFQPTVREVACIQGFPFDFVPDGIRDFRPALPCSNCKLRREPDLHLTITGHNAA